VSSTFVGIDVGARELHCAALSSAGRVVGQAVLSASDPEALIRFAAGSAAIAIDAPEAPSTAPHAADEGLAPKFRRARCAEIQLGRGHGCWVSWATPTSAPFAAWMEVGFTTFAALRRHGAPELLEVYPFAAFRELAGRARLPRKQTRAGREERARLLRAAGVAHADLAALTHHALDALVAAVVARDHARPVTCGHDGSRIWLPAPATR
jgi:predicted nuclease with RNAse H fold